MKIQYFDVDGTMVADSWVDVCSFNWNTNNTELMKIISQNLLNTMKRISTFFRLHVHFERKRINTGY